MYDLNIIDSIRKKAIDLIGNTSLEELNKTPEGFNNNIIWNFGHLVVSGYSLVFMATKVDPNFKIPLVDKFRKGTKPEESVTQEEIDQLIELSNAYTETIRVAMKEGRFANVSPYTTQTFGVEITSIEDMISTVALHDTTHWQTIRDYKRILSL